MGVSTCIKLGIQKLPFSSSAFKPKLGGGDKLIIDINQQKDWKVSLGSAAI